MPELNFSKIDNVYFDYRTLHRSAFYTSKQNEPQKAKINTPSHSIGQICPGDPH